MEIRKACNSEIAVINEILIETKRIMKEAGINQWQDGYPNEETIKTDIDNGVSYVVVVDEVVVATFMLLLGNDPNYDVIERGSWSSNDLYGVLHRIAVRSSVRNNAIGTKILNYCKETCLAHEVHWLRVDTHHNNGPMQRLLTKNKFNACGIIYVRDGTERVAFECKI